MSIKIKVNPTKSVILRATTMLLSELADLCSYQVISERSKKYSKACSSGLWDGRTSLLNKFTGEVPTGLIPKIVSYLKEKGYEVELEKNLPKSEEHLKMKNISPPPILRDYQKEAVQKMIKNKRGILQIVTGGGKTLCATALIGELKRPTLFYCHTIDLMDQAKSVFSSWFPDIKIGTIGDGVIDPGLITVASIQTISSWLTIPKEPKKKSKETTTEFYNRIDKYNNSLKDWEILNLKAKKFLKQFPIAILDEAHHVPSDTWFLCAQEMENSEWIIGLSATPMRESGDELLIEAASGSIIYSITISDLVEKGYLVPAEIHLHEYPPLPPMNLPDDYATQYKICITENEDRNAKIVELVTQENNGDKAIFVLCREIKHIENLSSLLESNAIAHETIHGKKKDRKEILQKFRDGKIRVLIGSSLLDEGIDLPEVNVVILAGAGRSRVKSYQRIGRSLRPYPGKTKATIHDFRDEVKPFSYHYNARLQLYNSEKAFTVVKHFSVKTRNTVKKQLVISKTLDDFNFEEL